MILDSAIHFRDKEFPWKEWEDVSTKFGAVRISRHETSATPQIVQEWEILRKGAHVTLVLVEGVHGGGRFHWKIMLSSGEGEPLHNAWLKYAIPYEAMGLLNCAFSDYTTETLKENQEDLLVFAKKNLSTVFSDSSLQQAGYLSSDNRLLLTTSLFLRV